MAEAKKGDMVKVHYTGRLTDGTQFDSSSGQEPLQFTIGQGQVIPGFENAVIGMSPGEKNSTSIPVDQGYGDHREEMVVQVPLEDLPAEMHPEVGQKVEARSEDGRQIVMTVIGLTDEAVTLDANHPLAGKELVFDVELVEIV